MKQGENLSTSNDLHACSYFIKPIILSVMTYICLKSLKRRVQSVSRFPRFIQVRPDSLQIDFNLSRGKDTKQFVTVNWLKPGVDMLYNVFMSLCGHFQSIVGG